MEEVACLWLNHYTRVTFQVIEYTSTVYTLAAPWLNHYTRVRVYTIHMYTRVTFQVIVHVHVYIRVNFQVIVYTCTSGSSFRSQCTRVHISRNQLPRSQRTHVLVQQWYVLYSVQCTLTTAFCDHIVPM